MRRLFSLLMPVGSVLGVCALVASAQAAPQALGVIAMEDGVSLHCVDGRCDVEVTAFCLQPDRPSPHAGTVYQAANHQDLKLVGTDVAGNVQTIDAQQHLSIRSSRQHKMVRFSVTEKKLAALGLTNVQLRIGQMVTLLPKPMADDPTPQTESDIALATGPMRALGDHLVDRDPDEGKAVRLMVKMINLLPAERRVSTKTQNGLWDKAGLGDAVATLNPQTQRRLTRGYENCKFIAGYRNPFNNRPAMSMRNCLEAVHDGMLDELNQRYWDGLGAGS